MRRRLLAGAAAAAVLLLAVLLWPVGLLTGGDDNKASSANNAKPAAAQTSTTGQAATGQPAGIAIVVDRNGKKQMLVRAARLAPSGQNQGYYVWLYNSPTDVKSLGGQVTDQQGNYQAIGPWPADYSKYKDIVMTKQPIGSSPNVKYNGQLVLRGPVPKLRNARGTAKKPVAVGQIPGVHDPGRVEPLLRRPDQLDAELADLRPHPLPVVAPDRVVVGDRAPAGEDRL
jgi:hypothetical protein